MQDGKLVKVFTNVESKVKKHSEEVIEVKRRLLMFSDCLCLCLRLCAWGE